MPYEISDRILSNNRPQFVGNIFNAACVPKGTQVMTKTVYHPRSNGQTEPYDRTIIDNLRHYISEHWNEWDAYVQTLEYS